MNGQGQGMHRNLQITAIVLLTTGMTLVGCKKKASPAPTPNPTTSTAPAAQPVTQPATSAPAANTQPESPRTAMPLPRSTKRLTDVVAAAKSWTSKSVSGSIGDFSVTDLEGNTHKLSDYRGKNVILTFWATWCPHCRIELPQLAKLRNDIKEEDLAILAISIISPRNPEAKVRQMSQTIPGINFPVIAAPADSLPVPFNQVEFLPCSFFIDPEGKLKMVTEGLVPAVDMKSILQSQ